jgi:hypothetical protein
VAVATESEVLVYELTPTFALIKQLSVAAGVRLVHSVSACELIYVIGNDLIIHRDGQADKLIEFASIVSIDHTPGHYIVCNQDRVYVVTSQGAVNKCIETGPNAGGVLAVAYESLTLATVG